MATLACVVLATPRAFAEEDCNEALAKLLKSDEALAGDLDLLRNMKKIEGQINWLREKGGHPARAARLRTDQLVTEIDALMVAGEKSQGIDRLRGLFRSNELAYLSALRLESQIAEATSQLAKGARDAAALKRLISSSEAELDTQMNIFGETYSDYLALRKHLEDLSTKPEVKCSARCRETATKVLGSVGLTDATRETFPELVRDSARPTLGELESFFNKHPKALLSQLRHERRLETWLFLKTVTLQRSFLEMAETAATRVPGLNRTKFVRVLKLLYDANARINDFPKIGRIMRAEGGLENQFEILVGYTSVDDGILTTFSRRVDTAARELWLALKEKSKNGSPDFLKKMEAAEAQARVMGDISLLYDKSPAAKVAILVVGGAVGGYTYAVSKHTVGVLKDDTIPLPEKIDRIRESPLVPFSTGTEKMNAPSATQPSRSRANAAADESKALKKELEEFYNGLEKIHEQIQQDPDESRRLDEILKAPKKS